MEAHGGERRYSSYSYLTSTLDGGEWSASHPGRALHPVPILQVAGWAPEPVWTQELEEKSFAPVGDRTLIVQPVVRHHTAWDSGKLRKVIKYSRGNFIHKNMFEWEFIFSLLRMILNIRDIEINYSWECKCCTFLWWK
jgi:hypothetical protein